MDWENLSYWTLLGGQRQALGQIVQFCRRFEISQWIPMSNTRSVASLVVRLPLGAISIAPRQRGAALRERRRLKLSLSFLGLTALSPLLIRFARNFRARQD